MSNIITGASGLLGARLVYDLFERKESITVLLRSEKSIENLKFNLAFYSKHPDTIIDTLKIHLGSLDDYEFLASVIFPDAKVYHCAAMVTFNNKHLHDLMHVNVSCTEILVNLCLEKQVQKFCHVSSIAALGNAIEGVCIDEKTPRSDSKKSGYSISKYRGEMEVWKAMAEGLNAVIVNPSVILGPGDWQKSSAEMVSTVAKGMKFYTKGSTGYVDVRDVSKAMILLMESEISEERFLLSAANLSYQELFTMLAKELQVPPPKFYANKCITGIAWRLLKFASLFSGNEPKITRNSHRSAHKRTLFNGIKITESLNFSYNPISETLKFVADKFKYSHASN